MLIYFIILSLPLLAHFFRFSLQGKSLEKIIVLLLAIFFCFGYMTGSDWRQYEMLYDWIDLSDPMSTAYLEPGYHYITFLFKFMGFDFWTFLIIAKLFCFFVAVKFIKKTVPEYFFLSLFVYLCLFGPYLYIDNPLRNLITASIFLLVIDFVRQQKFFSFLIIILLSMSIHLSSVLLIPVYFIINKKLSSTFIIIVYVAINILFVFFADIIPLIIVKLEVLLPFYSSKISAYFTDNSTAIVGTAFSLGYITKIISFILFMKTREKLEKRFGVMFFNCLIFFLIFYRVGLSIEVLYRFSMYFNIFFAIGTVYVLSCFDLKSKGIYFIFIMFISYYSLFAAITGSYKYIPYSNYLNYIFRDKPDFQKRSDYNYFNSPYQRK